MNEEFRLYNSFKNAYKRLGEIDNLVKFLDLEISIYGENTTLHDTKMRLQSELVVIKENLLNYFKEKGDLL